MQEIQTMKNMTVDQLKELLDRETAIRTVKFDNDKLAFFQSVPGFKSECAFTFIPDQAIEMIALILNDETRGLPINKLFLFCNDWNAWRPMPQAFVSTDDLVVARHAFDNRLDVSTDFIVNTIEFFVRSTLKMFEALRFFCDSCPDKIVLKDAREQIKNILRDF